MQTNVRITPDGNRIAVGGVELPVPFTADATIVAIEWDGKAGRVKYTGNTPDLKFGPAEYPAWVAGYVLLWQAEQARLNSMPTLETALKNKLTEIMHSYSAAFAPIEAVYPAAEREGWPTQEEEAKSLMADAKAQTPVLSALVQLRARGETTMDLAGKVLQNAGIWRHVYAHLTGQQQRMYEDVSGLSSVEAVLAYAVKYQMPEVI